MDAALVVLIVLAAGSAGADDGLALSCSNEIGLFCSGRTGAAQRRCLREHRDVALPGCREMIRELGSQADDDALTAVKPGAQRDARLVRSTGAVYLHRTGSPEGEFVAVSSGTPLLSGDWLRVGLDGAAELAFDGATSIGLSSGTDLALSSLSRAGTELRLALGTMTAKVAKLGRRQSFRVRTPNAVAAVRGTEFVVEQDEADGDSRVAVVDEGEVEVSASSGGEAVLVRPRQETAVRHDALAPEAPRTLTLMRARAEAYVTFRARAEQSAKTWAPTVPSARVQAREQLASLPTIMASRLTGVRPQQKVSGTPASFNRAPSAGGRTGAQPGGRTQAPPGDQDRKGVQPATAPRGPAAAPSSPQPGRTAPAPNNSQPSNDQRRTAPPKR